MSQFTDNFGSILGDAVLRTMMAKGPHFLYGAPSSGVLVKGRDEDDNEYMYAFPKLKLAHQAISSNPVALWFDKNYEKRTVRMNCEFQVDPVLTSTTVQVRPLKVMDLTITLRLGSTLPYRKAVKLNYNMEYPQMIKGTVDFNIQEFAYIKEQLEKLQVYFEWEGKIRWYDISNPGTVQHMMETKGKNVDLSSCPCSGKTDSVVVKESDDNMFGAVKGLLDWEKEVFDKVDSNGKRHTYVVWFKDTMVKDTYDFLPQVFWIKANPKTNKPSVTIVADPGDHPEDLSSHRLLFDFSIAPYYNPKAERDLFSVIRRRSSGKVKYCYFSQGGYEKAVFEWDNVFLNGFCKEVGIKPAVTGEVSISPDSSFNISLECTFTSADTLKTELSQGLVVGHVVFPEKEDMVLDVELNLFQLTQLFLEVQPQESTDKTIRFPYQAKILNWGDVDLTIGGCEMSVLSLKNGEIQDARHGLECGNTWPFHLPRKSGAKIQLSKKDVYDLVDNSRIAGIFASDHWSKLVCQPYSVTLKNQADVDRLFLTEYIDQIHTDIALRKMNVALSLSPDVWDKVTQVEVEVNPDNSTPETVTLDRKNPEKEILLTKTFLSIMNGKNERHFFYKYRVDTGSGYGRWSDDKEVSQAGTELGLFDNHILSMIQ